MRLVGHKKNANLRCDTSMCFMIKGAEIEEGHLEGVTVNHSESEVSRLHAMSRQHDVMEDDLVFQTCARGIGMSDMFRNMSSLS